MPCPDFSGGCQGGLVGTMPPAPPLFQSPAVLPAATAAAAESAKLGREVAVQVCRLLDVPRKPGMRYIVRALDKGGQLAATPEVGVASGVGGPPESVSFGAEGILRLRTDSLFVNLQAEYSDGSVLGMCEIYRPDPRSSTVSQYMFTDKSGQPANCGIELQVSDSLHEVSGSPVASQPGKTAGSFEVGMLQLRIVAAYNLTNTDTGIFGDVSDPYVVARVGRKEHRTPTIDNDLNPVWTRSNEFSFPVSADDGSLELEVMNSNILKNDCLGSTSVGLWSLPPGQWLRRREPLKAGKHGELEFELRFDPAQSSRADSRSGPSSRGIEWKEIPAPPPPPAAPRTHAGDMLLGPLAIGMLVPPAGPGAGGLGLRPPPGSLVAPGTGLYLPPLLSGWEASIVPRDQSMTKPMPLAPAKHAFSEDELLFPDMMRFELPKHEPMELWLKPPVGSHLDEFFGFDRDLEVLAANAEPWNAPVPAYHGELCEDQVFPDMDIGVVLKREGRGKGMVVRSDQQQTIKRGKDRVPEIPVDGWVPEPKKPERPKLKDKEPSSEQRPPSRPLTASTSKVDAKVSTDGAKRSAAVFDVQKRRRAAKLKVERELVRPDQARDIEEQCKCSEMLCLDPELRLTRFEAQVVSCIDFEFDAAGGAHTRSVWVTTPNSEPVMMEIAEDDSSWLEPFQTEELLVGVSCRRGHRGSRDPLPCQDCFSLTRLSANTVLYVVCDGHGPFGHLAAFRVSQSLPNALERLLQEVSQPELALVEAFDAASKELASFAEARAVDLSSSGTTCTVALRLDADVKLAWLGDSRALVATVTPDSQRVDLVAPGHTTEDLKELQRLRNAGAKLVQVPPGSGHLRIFTPGERTPGLQTTRALGDFSAQGLGIVWQPDIRKMSFARTPGLILLGSGGLWEMLEDSPKYQGEEILKLILNRCALREKGPGVAASNLVEEVQEQWKQVGDGFSDDTTCILLHWLRAQPGAEIMAPTPAPQAEAALTVLPAKPPAPRVHFQEPPRDNPEAGGKQAVSPEAQSGQLVPQMSTEEADVSRTKTTLAPMLNSGTLAAAALDARGKGFQASSTMDKPLSGAVQVEEVQRHCADVGLVNPDPLLRPVNFLLQLFGRVTVASSGSERGGWLRVPPAQKGDAASLVPLDAAAIREVLNEFQADTDAEISLCCRQSLGPLGVAAVVNQDNFSITSSPTGCTVYLVCDGHGSLGHLVSFRVAQSIPKLFLDAFEEASEKAPEIILAGAFESATGELTAWASKTGLDLSGSSATVSAVVRQGDAVHVAWLGDARVLVATTSGEFSRVDLMSRPHWRISDPVERQRLEAEGKIGGADPGLAVSRAIGDFESGVSSKPDLAKTSFSSAPGLVLIGSGALFRVPSGRASERLAIQGEGEGEGSGEGGGRLSKAPQEEGELVLDALTGNRGQLRQLGATHALTRLGDLAQELWQVGAAGSCDDVTGILLHWPSPGAEGNLHQDQAQQLHVGESGIRAPDAPIVEVEERGSQVSAGARYTAACASSSDSKGPQPVRFLQAQPSAPRGHLQNVQPQLQPHQQPHLQLQQPPHQQQHQTHTQMHKVGLAGGMRQQSHQNQPPSAGTSIDLLQPRVVPTWHPDLSSQNAVSHPSLVSAIAPTRFALSNSEEPTRVEPSQSVSTPWFKPMLSSAPAKMTGSSHILSAAPSNVPASFAAPPAGSRGPVFVPAVSHFSGIGLPAPSRLNTPHFAQGS
ncbi:unnamed protein product [Polarella glacialis]|uniref:Protein-serine/threonine phosphatase n=1 Tax=Polarella glacialis TaxID=89957 RepID=A0A813LVV8_POLGL|nr:unnamed protein product [Polarella glacialis]